MSTPLSIKRRRLNQSLASGLGLLLAGGGAVPLAALAQAPAPGGAVVKFILPNASGSGVDAITRAAAPALGRALGTSAAASNTYRYRE